MERKFTGLVGNSIGPMLKLLAERWFFCRTRCL